MQISAALRKNEKTSSENIYIDTFCIFEPILKHLKYKTLKNYRGNIMHPKVHNISVFWYDWRNKSTNKV